jgi:ribosomal protein S18 acetylase RimI-like enzyme
MIRKLNLQHEVEAQHLLDLQQKSYTVEARLIGYHDIPPLHDSLERLQQCTETFYGYFVKRQCLVGAISYKREGRVLDIHRLMVHPNHFRKGIAASLLQFVERAEDGVDTITVATGTKNKPAIHLYRRFGFRETENRELTPGISMTFFEKTC